MPRKAVTPGEGIMPVVFYSSTKDHLFKRLSDWRFFGALMGRPLSLPENHPPMDAETLRVRLTDICEWATAQPETGRPHPQEWSAYGYYWPLVPRAHPMYGWVQGMHDLARWGLTRVSRGRLHYATLIYHDCTLLSEHLSTHLLAERWEERREGSRNGGKSKRKVVYEKEAIDKAKEFRQRSPLAASDKIAGQILKEWKKNRPKDLHQELPAQSTIRGWISHMFPPR